MDSGIALPVYYLAVATSKLCILLLLCMTSSKSTVYYLAVVHD